MTVCHGDSSSINHSNGVKVYTWDEVSKHSDKSSRWIVLNNKVYDVTKWAYRHPGGSRVIGHFSGQDASEPFKAFHNDLNTVSKYLKAFYIGEVEASTKYSQLDEKEKMRSAQMIVDFDNLRLKAKEKDFFKSRISFFMLMLLQVFVLDALGYLVLRWFGTRLPVVILSLIVNTVAQVQCAWLQHDFGHLSVFGNSKLDHVFHQITMSFVKGASAHWWSHLHFQHHSKPNVLDKDPDVRLQPLFVLGDKMPIEVATKHPNRHIPYNFQHQYFFAIGPPLLFPLYFQVMVFRHVFTFKKYGDLLWMIAFYVKFIYLYYPLFGMPQLLVFYFIWRSLESHWFVWVSQSNHIPMHIEADQNEPWLSSQIKATCNVEQSAFNDWFTGHLNFQIEHHLFPTMPRHNYILVQPYVKELCAKYNIPYLIKPLSTAFADVVRSLKHAGAVWEAAKEAYNIH